MNALIPVKPAPAPVSDGSTPRDPNIPVVSTTPEIPYRLDGSRMSGPPAFTGWKLQP